MVGIVLKGHDYKYEVSELVKLFTSDFKFLDERDCMMVIDNSIFYHGDKVFSKTVYCENYEEILSNVDYRDLSGLDERARKKTIKETIKRSMFKILEKKFEANVPWGILTGIRPVKIVHALLDEGKDENFIKSKLAEDYYINSDKIELALDIAKRERKFIYPVDENKVSLYVSIPFCPTRCYYCSFPANSLSKFENMKPLYVEKLLEEVKGVAKLLRENNKEIETLYIGGGTPTTLTPEEMDTLITGLYKEFDLSNIKEFTVEAGRPDTINREILEVLKKHNVTRISINPQTMNDETLEKVGRKHTVNDIIECFQLARKLGFDNINMDIILGLVDENLEMVENTLKQIEKLSPESLTVHTLAVKRTSKLKEHIDEYQLTQFDEMSKMIDLSMKYAKKMGLNPYYMYRQKHMLGNLENIGYAKEGYECIYNIQMMEERQSNIALGAGSITKFVYIDENRIERVENVKNLEQYIDRVDEMINRKYEEVQKNVK
ncbi:MAG: coproporphyrinogen dehydrogenase HemZ [Intestinibacter sp.]|uniref:coproporphyrinogen dehydrogenase HemZ n=1 Tax=Intestinibacter sp. TaxID=1965304 RepID=UPI002A7EDEF1|nr:coproporphyrinogen dehydrogenase HemZ [Intestinibacter sp.]MDY4575506.1 coproporphyrinogen dehydrogenase HemZ [Intestinibacter sp.]